jgi:hypothetical protein
MTVSIFATEPRACESSRSFVWHGGAAMARIRHSWREACASALGESNPHELLGRIEYAITAIERRYAEWGTDPGTPAELNAIEKAIASLERQLEEKLEGYGDVPLTARWQIANASDYSVANELGHVRRLLNVLRSSPRDGKLT